MKRIGLLVPLVLALALAACNSGGGDSRASGGTPGGGGSAARAEPGKIADGAAEPRDRTGSLATALPVIGPKIVKNASLSLSIPRGKFEDDIDEAGRIANVFGGFVVSSNVDAGSEQRLVEGSLVLRIPAEHYGDALERLRSLGKARSLRESGEDMTREFVDLRARVRQLQAVEAQLLELLQRADGVPAALAVQNQLAQVQLDLEQAQGRLRYLDDQVAYSTISLNLHETAVAPPPSDGFSIVDAWATAGSAFLVVVGWIFVGLAVSAPVFIVLVLGFFAGRTIRRRLAQA
jgi:Domain of unknown function (DUF4349)